MQFTDCEQPDKRSSWPENALELPVWVADK